MQIRTKKLPKILTLLLACLIMGSVSPSMTLAQESPAKKKPKKRKIDVLFSPDGGCTERIIKEIGKAKKTIRIQAHKFTSSPIAKAVIEAEKRGVDCEVLLDQSQETEPFSELDSFFNQDIPVLIESNYAIAHNKIMLIDKRTIITGSFDFTRAAERKNAENLLIIRNHDHLFAKYAKNYEKHRADARRYTGYKRLSSKPRAPPKPDKPKANKPKEKKPPRAKTPPKEDYDPTVYVTKTGGKYHRGSCSYLRKSRIAMRLSDARGGHSPCSRCRPPR